MKTKKRWVTAVISDAIMATLFYYWQAQGSEGAGNVFMFAVWVFAVITILIGLVLKPEDKTELIAGPGFRLYSGITDTLIIAALAWIGQYPAAVAYMIGAIAVASARKGSSAADKAASA